MSVVLARIDERLIHGQVATAWLRLVNVSTVIVVDDESAHDEMKQMLLEMAVSGQIECVVTDLEHAKEVIDSYERKKVFLCAADVGVYVELLRQGVAIPEVNIGGIYKKDDRVQVYKTVFVDEKIKNDILALQDYPDTKVSYRMVPQDPDEDIIAKLKTM